MFSSSIALIEFVIAMLRHGLDFNQQARLNLGSVLIISNTSALADCDSKVQSRVHVPLIDRWQSDVNTRWLRYSAYRATSSDQRQRIDQSQAAALGRIASRAIRLSRSLLMALSSSSQFRRLINIDCGVEVHAIHFPR